MYIEFSLPTGAAGMAAQWVNSILNQELHAWSDRFQIPYNTKLVKYTKRITFDDEKNYAFFALTWNPQNTEFATYLLEYRLIEPMRRV